MVSQMPGIIAFAIDREDKVWVLSWLDGTFSPTTLRREHALPTRGLEKSSLIEIQVQTALGILTHRPVKDVGNELPKNCEFYLLYE